MNMAFRILAAGLALGLLELPAEVRAHSPFPDHLRGVCITGVPESGGLQLDGRMLRAGEVLTAEQAARVIPVSGEPGALVRYLPVSDKGVEAQAVIPVGRRDNQPPQALDSLMETYQNRPNTHMLRVSDPEEEELTFTLIRPPRRGNVTISEDGTCTYTPKKNKVGVDSFTYTAADPQGNLSREATVTVDILTPSSALPYTDTAGESCAFSAEWMKHTGIFTGETVDGRLCFRPREEVNPGDFLAMLVSCLHLPPEEKPYHDCMEDMPLWLQPYFTAALRSGITAGIPRETFLETGPMTEQEAAVLVENVLDIPLADLAGDGPLTRGKAAEFLYAVHLKKIAEPRLLP